MRGPLRLLALCLLVTPAGASTAQTVGVGSRATALAGAFTAQADDFSAIWYNPAGLALQGHLEVAAAPLMVLSDLWVEDRGAPREDAGAEDVGYFLALSGPLGALFDLDELAAGLLMYLPSGPALDIQIPERADARLFPLYGERMRRLAIVPALSLCFGDRIALGVALDVFLDLDAPTVAAYDPEPVHPQQEQLEIDVSRDLPPRPSLIAGLLVKPIDRLAVALTWRGEQRARTAGRNVFLFGDTDEPTFDLDLLYISFYSPAELAGGVSVEVSDAIWLNADVVWARWSGFRDPHGVEPDPPFEDVIVARLGAGWRLGPVNLLGGWAWLPSPAPAPTGVGNLADADRQQLALGAEVADGSFTVGVHTAVQLLAERTAEKDPTRLPDRDPDTPGQQIDELGYPGYRFGGQVYNLGLTVRWTPL